MIIVAMILWVFAVWSIASTLRLRLHPAVFWFDLQQVFTQPPAIEQAVPALLMLVLIVATPLLLWNLIAEWDATFRLTNEGLSIRRWDFACAITGIIFSLFNHNRSQPMKRL